jgi:hypothetical protein
MSRVYSGLLCKRHWHGHLSTMLWYVRWDGKKRGNVDCDDALCSIFEIRIVGSTSSASAKNCTACSLGTSQPYASCAPILTTIAIDSQSIDYNNSSTAQIQCISCTAGYYANVTGMATCLPCAGTLLSRHLFSL